MHLQLKFWLLGLVLALPLGLTNLLPPMGCLSILGKPRKRRVGRHCRLRNCRYRLMDIELVVTRALVLVRDRSGCSPVFLDAVLAGPRIRKVLRFFRRARSAHDCRGRRVPDAGIHREAIGADLVPGEGGKPNQACCFQVDKWSVCWIGIAARFVVRVVVRGVRSGWALHICSR